MILMISHNLSSLYYDLPYFSSFLLSFIMFHRKASQRHLIGRVGGQVNASVCRLPKAQNLLGLSREYGNRISIEPIYIYTYNIFSDSLVRTRKKSSVE